MESVPTITVETTVNARIDKVWDAWNMPNHIVHWAFASDDWEASEAENDLRRGGRFKTVMGARDKSVSFDFTGVYRDVKEYKLIEYDIDDGRRVTVAFENKPPVVRIIETFVPEDENTTDMQRTGWQAILDNFKKYVEGS